MPNNLKELNPVVDAPAGSLVQVSTVTRNAIWRSGCVGGCTDYESLYKVSCGPLQILQRVGDMLHAVPADDASHVYVFRCIDVEPWTNHPS